MKLALAALVSLAALSMALIACGGDDEAGSTNREIEIVQGNDACTPAQIELKTGEKVTFRVVNESGDDQEVEGEDGTKLEEVLVPAGKTRSIGFTAPSSAGTGTLKCYRPGGQETMIKLVITS